MDSLLGTSICSPITKPDLEGIKKWENTAAANMFDNAFFDFISMCRAHNNFQRAALPLTESNFRAQSAILNGLITSRLDSASCGSLDSKRICTYILSLDQLIANSLSLAKTESTTMLQEESKAMLYLLIANYLLVSMKFAKRAYDDRRAVNAVCAYAFALDILLDHQRRFKQSSPTLMNVFGILETFLSLRMNLTSDPLKRLVKEALAESEVHKRLHAVILEESHSLSQQQPSFIAADGLHKTLANWHLPNVNVQEYLPKMWQFRNHRYFFRRFFWVLHNLTPNDDKTFSFVDDAFSHLKEFPKDIDYDYKIDGFTRLDMKVLFFRMGFYYNIPKAAAAPFLSEIGVFVSCPWLACPQINSDHSRVLKGFDQFLSKNQQPTPPSGKLAEIHLVAALQEIRLSLGFIADKRNLWRTAEFLAGLCVGMANEEKEICKALAQRYVDAVLDSEGTWKNPNESPLFPPVETLSENENEEIARKLEKLFVTEKRADANENVKKEVKVEIPQEDEKAPKEDSPSTASEDNWEVVEAPSEDSTPSGEMVTPQSELSEPQEKADDVGEPTGSVDVAGKAEDNTKPTSSVLIEEKEEPAPLPLPVIHRRGRIVPQQRTNTINEKTLAEQTRFCMLLAGEISKTLPNIQSVSSAKQIEEIRKRHEKDIAEIDRLRLNEKVRSLEKTVEMQQMLMEGMQNRHATVMKMVCEIMRPRDRSGA